MVRQARHHGLDQSVVPLGDGLRAIEGQDGERAEHDQRRQHADGEEVAGPHEQGQAEADEHEPQVEEHADPADHGHVDHDGAQGDGRAERDDGATRLAALVPDRPGLAHRATLGGSSRFCRDGAPGQGDHRTGPRQVVVGHAEVAEPPRGHQHPRLQRADRGVVVADRRVERPPDGVDVRDQRGQPLVQLAAQTVDLLRLVGQPLLAPPVGNGAEQRDERGRGREHDLAGRRVVEEVAVGASAPPRGTTRRARTAPRTPGDPSCARQ